MQGMCLLQSYIIISEWFLTVVWHNRLLLVRHGGLLVEHAAHVGRWLGRGRHRGFVRGLGRSGLVGGAGVDGWSPGRGR